MGSILLLLLSRVVLMVEGREGKGNQCGEVYRSFTLSSYERAYHAAPLLTGFGRQRRRRRSTSLRALRFYRYNRSNQSTAFTGDNRAKGGRQWERGGSKVALAKHYTAARQHEAPL